MIPIRVILDHRLTIMWVRTSGGSVWSPWFSLCSRPCLVSTAGALRSPIPAHPLPWRADTALGHLGTVNHKTAASKEPMQINEGRKDWTRFYNSEALVRPVQFRICSQTAFAVDRFDHAFIPRGKGNFFFFLQFPQSLPSNWFLTGEESLTSCQVTSKRSLFHSYLDLGAH